jgi:tripartite-type tricarboxylate transporter receptor subunit TctC
LRPAIIDVLARRIGQRLSEHLRQTICYREPAGAGGNIMADGVVRAPGQGYRLLLVGANIVLNASFYKKLKFNHCAMQQQRPASIAFARSWSRSLVSGATLPEFIAYAKTIPGKVNFASAGNGSIAHGQSVGRSGSVRLRDSIVA